jgi:hypothetical protein
MKATPTFRWLLPLLALCCFFPSALNAQTLVTTISGSPTWTKSGSPYLVQNDVTVAANATLTIQAGVVVKFKTRDYQMNINGKVIANGTATEPIIFTSIKMIVLVGTQIMMGRQVYPPKQTGVVLVLHQLP